MNCACEQDNAGRVTAPCGAHMNLLHEHSVRLRAAFDVERQKAEQTALIFLAAGRTNYAAGIIKGLKLMGNARP